MIDEPPDQIRFESAVEELGQIVDELEQGGVDLGSALARYARGIGLLNHCQRTLDDAERTVALLTGADSEGNAITSPFDGSMTVDPANLQGRGGR